MAYLQHIFLTMLLSEVSLSLLEGIIHLYLKLVVYFRLADPCGVQGLLGNQDYMKGTNPRLRLKVMV